MTEVWGLFVSEAYITQPNTLQMVFTSLLLTISYKARTSQD